MATSLNFISSTGILKGFSCKTSTLTSSTMLVFTGRCCSIPLPKHMWMTSPWWRTSRTAQVTSNLLTALNLHPFTRPWPGGICVLCATQVWWNTQSPSRARPHSAWRWLWSTKMDAQWPPPASNPGCSKWPTSSCGGRTWCTRIRPTFTRWRWDAKLEPAEKKAERKLY